MSFFTDFRDSTLQNLGLSKGDDAAANLAKLAQNARNLVPRPNIETKPDANNTVKDNTPLLGGNGIKNLIMPGNLSPIVIFGLMAGAFLFFSKKRSRG